MHVSWPFKARQVNRVIIGSLIRTPTSCSILYLPIVSYTKVANTLLPLIEEPATVTSFLLAATPSSHGSLTQMPAAHEQAGTQPSAKK